MQKLWNSSLVQSLRNFGVPFAGIHILPLVFLALQLLLHDSVMITIQGLFFHLWYCAALCILLLGPSLLISSPACIWCAWSHLFLQGGTQTKHVQCRLQRLFHHSPSSFPLKPLRQQDEKLPSSPNSLLRDTPRQTHSDGFPLFAAHCIPNKAAWPMPLFQNKACLGHKCFLFMLQSLSWLSCLHHLLHCQSLSILFIHSGFIFNSMLLVNILNSRDLNGITSSQFQSQIVIFNDIMFGYLESLFCWKEGWHFCEAEQESNVLNKYDYMDLSDI